jgi:hypothetical protein
MGKKFRRLIVHVGMHKTGSTTLQYALEKMKWGPVGPMDMLEPNHSFPCNLWFGPIMESRKNLLNFGHTPESAQAHLEKVKNRVRRQLKWSRRKELVISGEWLSTGMHPEAGRQGVLESLKNEFEPYFDQIDVYGYVRRPVAFSTSASQQIMKLKPGFQVPWANYRRRFEPLFDVFGHDHVHLRLFERNELVGGDIVTDFQEWQGWPQKKISVPSYNEGMSVAGVALVNCFQSNRPPVNTVEEHKKRILIVDALTKLDGPKFALSKRVVAKFFRNRRADLDWIESTLGRDVSDQGKPLPEGAYEIGSEVLLRVFRRFCLAVRR